MKKLKLNIFWFDFSGFLLNFLMGFGGFMILITVSDDHLKLLFHYVNDCMTQYLYLVNCSVSVYM